MSAIKEHFHKEIEAGMRSSSSLTKEVAAVRGRRIGLEVTNPPSPAATPSRQGGTSSFAKGDEEKKKELPLLFSTPMIIANLENRKTQTRRTRGLKQVNEAPGDHVFWGMELNPKIETTLGKYKTLKGYFAVFGNEKEEYTRFVKSPYGQPGDWLWVRETSRRVSHYGFEDPFTEFKAGGNTAHCTIPDLDQIIPMSNWKPSIHMPKIAARLWLEMEKLTLERVQDISEEDAKAEGIPYSDVLEGYECQCCFLKGHKGGDLLCEDGAFPTAKESFQSLWHSINGRESWDANPWVWVIKYKELSRTGKPEIK